MIRINKSLVPPAILVGLNSRGVLAARSLNEAFQRGDSIFEFDRCIYGALDVRRQLFLDQRRKCAYCENSIRQARSSDVEHFRPKAGWVQTISGSLNQPGYFWLAYDWSNLLLSCPECNQRFKKNQFPLLNPSGRAKPDKQSLTNELPALINPAQEDPREYIRFKKHIARGIDGRKRGAKTIRILGLNKDPVREERREWLKVIQPILAVFKSNAAANNSELHAWLDNRCQPESPFSSMVLDAVRPPQ